jgi:hypothetical protein
LATRRRPVKRRVAHWESEYRRLSAMSESALYHEVSRRRPRHREPGIAYKFSFSVGDGRRWFQRRLHDIADAVCKHPRVRTLLQRRHAKEELFLAVVDVLMGYWWGVPAATLSALVVRSGVEELCRERQRRHPARRGHSRPK